MSRPKNTDRLPDVAGLKAHYDSWRKNILGAADADRQKVEQAIATVYRRTGQPEPAVIWCKGLYQFLLLPLFLDSLVAVKKRTGQARAESPSDDWWNSCWDLAWVEAWSSENFANSIAQLTSGRAARATPNNLTSYRELLHIELDQAAKQQAKDEIGKALRLNKLKLNFGQYSMMSKPQMLPNFEFARTHFSSIVTAIRSKGRQIEEWREWRDSLVATESANIINRSRARNAPGAASGQTSGDVAGNEVAAAEAIDDAYWSLTDLEQLAAFYETLARRIGRDLAMPGVVCSARIAQELADADLLTQLWPEYFQQLHADFAAWRDIAMNTSLVLIGPSVAFVCEKHTRLSPGIAGREFVVFRTLRRRLHSADGPVIKFADGFAEYAWQGVFVPRHVIESPEQITVEEIDKSLNVEVRRVLIERFGLAKYMLASGAKLVHEDLYGSLYRKELPGDEPLFMVKVINKTAEPDGTFKEYFLRVPPTMATAKQAVAWTFGFNEKDYDPKIQS